MSVTTALVLGTDLKCYFKTEARNRGLNESLLNGNIEFYQVLRYCEPQRNVSTTVIKHFINIFSINHRFSVSDGKKRTIINWDSYQFNPIKLVFLTFQKLTGKIYPFTFQSCMLVYSRHILKCTVFGIVRTKTVLSDKKVQEAATTQYSGGCNYPMLLYILYIIQRTYTVDK